MMSDCLKATEGRRNRVKVKYETYYAIQILTLKYLPHVRFLIADCVAKADVQNLPSFVLVFKLCHITKNSNLFGLDYLF